MWSQRTEREVSLVVGYKVFEFHFFYVIDLIRSRSNLKILAEYCDIELNPMLVSLTIERLRYASLPAISSMLSSSILGIGLERGSSKSKRVSMSPCDIGYLGDGQR